MAGETTPSLADSLRALRQSEETIGCDGAVGFQETLEQGDADVWKKAVMGRLAAQAAGQSILFSVEPGFFSGFFVSPPPASDTD